MRMSKWLNHIGPGLVIVLMLAGCGASPSAVTIDTPAEEAFQTELFTDDQDPALAGLDFVENELLVSVLPGADPEDVAAAYDQAGVTPVGELADIDLRVLRVDEGTLESAGEILAAIDRGRSHPRSLALMRLAESTTHGPTNHNRS